MYGRFAPRAAVPAKSHFDPERKFRLVTKFDILIRAKRNGLESAHPNVRCRVSLAFESNQRPWLRMMRSGCHDSIFWTAARVFRFYKRSGNRMPKNIWPRG